MDLKQIEIQLANKSDIDTMQEIREKAFKPIFQSFRNILGDIVYETAQEPEDIAQGDLLPSYFEADSIWKTWKVVLETQIIGFVTIRFDQELKVGEIGLNAIDPDFGGRGIGTYVYEFAIQEMKNAGMKVATVATGGDISHLPARKAYRNAGFNIEIPSVWMCKEL
jgi:GNAT superfamily N-acetyltransferase